MCNYVVNYTLFEKQKLELTHMCNCFPTLLCSKKKYDTHKLKQNLSVCFDSAKKS